MPLIDMLTREPVPREVAFPESEYRERLRKVRARMVADALDVLLVTSMPNLCYLTGYDTVAPNAYAVGLVPLTDAITLHLPEMEVPCALLATHVTDLVVHGTWTGHRDAASHLAALLRERGYGSKRIGIEARKASSFGAATMDGASYLRLKELLPDAEIQDATDLVLDIRLIKSPAELAYMRRAGEMTWEGVQAALAAAAPGRTDNQLVAAAYAAMVGHGSDRLCNQPMVLTGSRTGWGPHLPNKRVALTGGDPIHIECSGCYERYNAPLIRGASLGEPPGDVRRLADVSLSVLELVLEHIRAGRTAHEVAVAARKGLPSTAGGMHFFGSFGYSVGLSLPPGWTTEAPWYIAEGNDRPLEVGMTFHLIGAAALPGRYRVGFSETAAVTETGLELLTPGLGRELTVCRA